jgi:hypothetical protein
MDVAIALGILTLTYGALASALAVVAAIVPPDQRRGVGLVMMAPITLLLALCLFVSFIAFLWCRDVLRRVSRLRLVRRYQQGDVDDVELGGGADDDSLDQDDASGQRDAIVLIVRRAHRCCNSAIKNDDECAICLESLVLECAAEEEKSVRATIAVHSTEVVLRIEVLTEPVVVLPTCAHAFHAACLCKSILASSSSSPTCPLCVRRICETKKE